MNRYNYSSEVLYALKSDKYEVSLNDMKYWGILGILQLNYIRNRGKGGGI